MPQPPPSDAKSARRRAETFRSTPQLSIKRFASLAAISSITVFDAWWPPADALEDVLSAFESHAERTMTALTDVSVTLDSADGQAARRDRGIGMSCAVGDETPCRSLRSLTYVKAPAVHRLKATRNARRATMSTTNGNQLPGIVGRLADWWHNLRAARMRLGELQRCGDNLGNIARDLGLSPWDLCAMAAKSPDAADEHRQRLAALDIDRAALLQSNPRAARDLERVCSLCSQKRRCEGDLASHPNDPVWRTYCPNTQTLDALKEAATAAA